MRGAGCELPLNLSPEASSNVMKESKNTLAIQSGNLQGDKLNLNRSRWDACPGAWLKLRQILSRGKYSQSGHLRISMSSQLKFKESLNT